MIREALCPRNMSAALLLLSVMGFGCQAMMRPSSSYAEIEDITIEATSSITTPSHDLLHDLSGKKKKVEYLSDHELQAEVVELLKEEAELAECVHQWKWLPDFPTRFRTSQLVRTTLTYERWSRRRFSLSLPSLYEIAEETTQEIISITEALLPQSITTYYFAYFLSTGEAVTEFTSTLSTLDDDDQRMELYTNMQRRCVEKLRKGKTELMHMEVHVCSAIYQVQRTLQQMQNSQLPRLLAEKNAWVETERQQRIETETHAKDVATPSRHVSEKTFWLRDAKAKNQRHSWSDMLWAVLKTKHTNDKAIELNDRRHSWAGFWRRFSDDDTNAAAMEKPNAPVDPPEPMLDTDEWRRLRGEIARHNMLLTQVLKAYFRLSVRFFQVFKKEHAATVQKALEWNREASSTEQMFLKEDASDFLQRV